MQFDAKNGLGRVWVTMVQQGIYNLSGGGGTKSEGLVPRKCAKSMEGGAFHG